MNMLSQFRALVPRQRSSQLCGQLLDLLGDGIADRLGASTSQGRSILDPGTGKVSGHRRQMQQHCESSGAFHKRADCRAVQADDHVAFPVTGHGAVCSFGGTLANHHFWSD
jgi:hypothetical protein